jgi:cell division protein FtsB
MSMTKREKILIAVVLILAVICVYYLYILKPSLDQLGKLNADNANKGLSVSTGEQIQAMVESIEEKIADDESRIAQYSDTVLSKFDQPAAIVYLYDTISQYGRKIMFSFEEIKDVQLIKVNRVTVTLNATYDGLKKLVKALSEGEYYVKVTGVEASVITPDSDAGVQPSGETGLAEEPAAVPPSPSLPNNTLSITMTLEFYNFDGEIPPDKQYTFSDGASYGGDIFY